MNDEYYENEYNEEENSQRRGYSISDSARNLKSSIDNVRDISNRLKNRSNDSVYHEEASDISNRINNTRNQSLINNNVNPNDINGLSSSGIANEGLTPKATNSLGNGANALNEIDAAKNAGELASGAGKALETAKGASDAVKAGSTIASGAGATAGSAAATVGTTVTTAGASAVGTAAAATGGFPVIAIVLIAAVVIIGLLLLVVFMSDFTNSNLGMKYGLTNEQAYNTFANEYKEGMGRYEINGIYNEKGFDCPEVGFWAKLGIAFGNYNLSDADQMCQYIKDKLDNYETNGLVLSPGYVFSSLYYAFDTQNSDEEGNPYLSIEHEDEKSFETSKSVQDMDVLTSLFTFNVMSKEDMDILFDNNVLK